MDIVTSLGADEEKIILAGTAKANRFNLLDVSRNTPGSASVGMASTITYQQVCSFFLAVDFPKSVHISYIRCPKVKTQIFVNRPTV